MSSKEKQEYKGIFQSTFLFGFVQVFNILIKVGLNKCAATFLGTQGIGIIGIFQSVSDILKTFFGLGVSQSAVRDVSKANQDGDKKEISKIISVTHKVIFFTALLGGIFTVVFSSYLSIWSFRNESYAKLFILLALVVFLNILSEGQLAILKGMRKLKELAKATVWGSLAGFISGVPFYYFLRNDGIVPTFLAVAISMVFFSTYYVRKIKYEKIKLTIKEVSSESSNMVKMGVALMLVTFIGMLSQYVIKIFIEKTTSLSMAGIYHAGLTMISSYFGIVITAMSTDYYPRISAVYDDNKELTVQLNRQTKVGLILVTPLIVIFMFLMPFFVQLLYSSSFSIVTQYMQYAIFWVVLIIVSNPIDMILIAKQNTKVFIAATIVYRIIGLGISLLGYKYYGLQGLGVAMMLMGVLHIILMQGIMYKKYKILIDGKTLSMLILSIFLLIISLLVINLIDNFIIKYAIGIVLLSLSVIYSIKCFKDITRVNLLDVIKSKINKKKNG